MTYDYNMTINVDALLACHLSCFWGAPHGHVMARLAG